MIYVESSVKVYSVWLTSITQDNKTLEILDVVSEYIRSVAISKLTLVTIVPTSTYLTTLLL
jgi:hypothetical protein